MTDFISNLIASLSANIISDAFILLIVAVFFISLLLSVVGKAVNFTSNTPNLLTSLGILGTFAGIVVGLMEFNPKDIDGSIELLLGGLKTAFLTSLMGMATSIIYKGIDGFIERKSDDVGEVGPEEIHAVMAKQLEASEEIIKSIKGEEESSLTSQIRLMRQDFNDGNKGINLKLESISGSNDSLVAHAKELDNKHEAFQLQLWKKMEEFGDLLSKSATEQVINALKEVIVEFNDKLTEQFGENFKRLDESVKKLVDWQENYRHQLEDMANKYQLGVDAIASTEKSVASIGDRAEAIPQTMEKLHSVMEIGHGQVTELEDRLEAFKDLRDKAVEAMPQIREQMDNTMSAIGDSVQAASKHYEDMLVESKSVIDQFSAAQLDATTQFKQSANDGIETMKSGLQDGASKVSEELMRGAQDISGKLTESAQDITSNVGSASGHLNDMANHIAGTTDNIRQHLEDTITELNAEVRSLVAGIKEDSAETGKILTQANSELLHDTKAAQEETRNAINQMQQRLETSLEEVFQIQAQAVRRTFDSLEEQITTSVGQTGNAVEKQVEYLDSQMQQEINRTMNEMGQALATITQQFTGDYQKLVREMANVVNSSRVAS